MMARLPTVKPKRLLAILKRVGFKKVRQKGSHLFLWNHSIKRGVVIPMHNTDVGRGLLRKISREADLDINEFIKLLNKKR